MSDFKKENSVKKGTKIISVVLTIAILTLLVLSGPAQGYILGLAIDNPEVQKGAIVEISLKADLQDGDEADNVALMLDGPGPLNFACKFGKNGNIIEGCNGIQVKKIDTNFTSQCSGYGYGYGYGDCVKEKLEFNLTLNSSEFVAGTYATKLIIQAGNKTAEKQGGNIKIIGENRPIEGCSVRGKGGVLTTEDITFSNEKNKLNFFIPLRNAKNGQGYLISQKGRETFQFKFDVMQVLENNGNEAFILVDGKSRIGLGKEKEESAVILFILDKANKRIDMIGDDLALKNMQTTFMSRC